jgi:hypothetical protein
MNGLQINKRAELFKLLEYFNLPKVVAELGVAEGLFARDMMNWGLDKLYAVDNWGHIPGTTGDGNFEQEWHDKNYANAKNLLQPFGDKVVFLRGMTGDMAKYVEDESLGMVYIDAGHSYEAVLNDLKTWAPKVIGGGIIAGHDYLATQYGVRYAVRDFICEISIPEAFSSVLVIPETNDDDAGFYFIKY